MSALLDELSRVPDRRGREIAVAVTEGDYELLSALAAGANRRRTDVLGVAIRAAWAEWRAAHPADVQSRVMEATARCRGRTAQVILGSVTREELAGYLVEWRRDTSGDSVQWELVDELRKGRVAVIRARKGGGK